MSLVSESGDTGAGPRFRHVRLTDLIRLGCFYAAAKFAPVKLASSTGRCNTVWYKAVFKGGVYDPSETVWAFSGAEERRMVPLEGGTVVA